MNIGEKLKNARNVSQYTQERIAEELQVSRQTISSWENNRSYPDIISLIKLSNLYKISLDSLLKDDIDMIKHLDESTNIVASNKKLIFAFMINIILFILMILFNSFISSNHYLIGTVMILAVISTSTLFYLIIRRF